MTPTDFSRKTQPETAATIPSGQAGVGTRLLVVLPALDEEQTIGDVIRRIPRDLAGIRSVSVLVVDDGSRDRTAERAREAGAQVVHHARRRGVGAAFHTALAHAIEQSADLLVSLDADGQFDPVHLPTLIAPVLSGEADFVSASRFMDPALTPSMPRLKRWGNRMMSRLVSHIAGETFHDVSCGMRCYGREAMMHLNLLGAFTYTQEVFLSLSFKHLRIVEVPLPIRGERSHGKSRVARSLWLYGWRAAKILFRCYRDYRPMRFFGTMAVIFAVPAVLLEGFLGVHYLLTGEFTPHKWAGFTGLGLLAIALAALHMGLIGDMLNRHRIYLEEILYHSRKTAHDSESREKPPRP
jgi:glycosyltransferase involved in cell wall biosynthesis